MVFSSAVRLNGYDSSRLQFLLIGFTPIGTISCQIQTGAPAASNRPSSSKNTNALPSQNSSAR
ncbi:hypothetical protein BN2497_13983 [Janthinobacterium sp. CG23_2]|nr:hypothetical protein BN2497_13983 [Janthinobacterium sp. CG23_2]CUU33389.1 hypothetical protein BN3177_13983 [Janthinobacterium sp. CG23_2]